uniref:Uncharacterized protein n=1 Tax=Anguilla anguilla TaxID=7936 RepID=A0A0E9PQ64_ANGAN
MMCTPPLCVRGGYLWVCTHLESPSLLLIGKQECPKKTVIKNAHNKGMGVIFWAPLGESLYLCWCGKDVFFLLKPLMWTCENSNNTLY